MMQRLKFECWNCRRDFSLFLETAEKPDLISECPYCASEVLIELDPYRQKQTSLFKSLDDKQPAVSGSSEFPELIPTKRPNQE
jgi:DNA-directed RNA polymerase subunit RPC12/RpoP